MLFGACAGSTTGGIKCIRIAIMSRVSKNDSNISFIPMLYFLYVSTAKLFHQQPSLQYLHSFFYIWLLFLIGWLVLMLFGVGFEEAYSVVISSLGNVGPGIGKCGPSYSWSGLPVCKQNG